MEYNGIILTLSWIESLHIAIALHACLITSLTSILAKKKRIPMTIPLQKNLRVKTLAFGAVHLTLSRI